MILKEILSDDYFLVKSSMCLMMLSFGGVNIIVTFFSSIPFFAKILFFVLGISGLFISYLFLRSIFSH
jgi:uncharacterized membrane protein YuzA (DUF378 family)